MANLSRPADEDQLELFAGDSFEFEYDADRLTGQLRRVFEFMAPGGWHTLSQISEGVGGSEAGISARLRDLRKSRFGGHTVERRRRGDPSRGLFEYRLVLGEGNR